MDSKKISVGSVTVIVSSTEGTALWEGMSESQRCAALLKIAFAGWCHALPEERDKQTWTVTMSYDPKNSEVHGPNFEINKADGLS